MDDDLSGKLRGLFKKKAKGAFKGAGHKLGGSEPGASTSAPRTGAPQRPQQRPAGAPAAGAAAGAAAAGGAAATAPATAARQPPRSTAAPQQPAAAERAQPVLLPAAEFDPFQPAVGGGGALNVVREPPPALSSADSDAPPAPATAAEAAAALAAAPAPTAAQVSEIRRAAALVLSQPGAAASYDVFCKLLANLLSNPREPKYRQLRLANRRIREAVVEPTGGCELLAAVGFSVHGDDGGGDDDGGFAVFLEDDSLSLAAEGLAQLRELAGEGPGGSSGGGGGRSGGGGGRSGGGGAAAADSGTARGGSSSAAGTSVPVGASSSGGGGADSAGAAQRPVPAAAAAAAAAATTAPAAAPAAPAVDRRLRVLLPVADTAIDLDASLFQRTPAEFKAEFARAAAARRAGEVMTTKAFKEAQRAAGRGPPPTRAAVRVRFPEGLQLEAQFGAAEPLEAVYAAVAACLRAPAPRFELIAPPPDRRPLPRAGGRVGDAGLAPSALLNFRALEPGPAGGLPALSDEMLARATVD
ncbi:hypothetical protein Rsub_07782 [Raphidocelis subcapitata]|uniref:UBX domain-containing protein n=1 Tax=Raphidocelis subcapitata TaxID=307507 RepID=A0A2V0P653_9CHLO|nr:hypothetical protein Rsub_07782 [Raphidocelis subcapitata]|eukprot:GBF95354.1 hypothetical protein Rsub_07782 [Raphidocelis subcapitata]